MNGTMKLILIGQPGSGKGTQAIRLKEKYRLSHISSGDVLRKEVALGTDLGKAISSYMDRGEIGPVELITEAVLSRLDRISAEGFILDGFPRTVFQAGELKKRQRIDAVLFIDVPEDEVVDRITGRLTCPSCGMIYHLRRKPPVRENVCDGCGTALSRRSDDNEDTVRNRIRVYREDTFPLLDFYREEGLLRRINGANDADTVFAEITALLG